MPAARSEGKAMDPAENADRAYVGGIVQRIHTGSEVSMTRWAAVGLAFATMAVAQSGESFTSTGDLTEERTFHTATLLTNNKVLVAGGFAVLNGFPVRASAELYDPATGKFTPTGSMTTGRFNHTATLLPNGK